MGTELYQHMCNCFTSTLHGDFHAVVFHCIIKFWVYSCSCSTCDQFCIVVSIACCIIMPWCTCTGSQFMYLCIYVWSCLSITLIFSLKTYHRQMRSTGTVWQLMPAVLDLWIKALFTVNFMAWFAHLECHCGAFQTLNRQIWPEQISLWLQTLINATGTCTAANNWTVKLS